MTARRSSGSASDAAKAFGRALAPPPARSPAGPVTPAKGVPAAAAKAQDQRSKYTLLLEPEDADTFDRLMITARRMLGTRRLDKSGLLRVLINLAADDPALLAQVVEEIRRREAGGPAA